MSSSSRLNFGSGMRVIGNRITITDSGKPPAAEEDKEPEGYKDGYAEGYAAAQAELQGKIEELSAALGQAQAEVEHLTRTLPEELNTFLRELEDLACREATELAFQAAERIVSHEVDRESNVLPVIHEALQRLTHIQGVKLMLSPHDYVLLTSTQSDQLPPGLELIQDAMLQPGELFLESQQGFLDGKYESRLLELKAQFMELSFSEGDDNA